MAKPRSEWGDARLIRAIHQQFGGVLYHLADEANAESIDAHGLLSKDEAALRGISPPMTGGNGLTRALDARDSLSDHVFIAFFKAVLMPKDDSIDRLRHPMMLAIAPEVLLLKDVEVRLGRGTRADRVGVMQAVYKMDWEIWERPELRANPFGGKARWNSFLNYEILVPKCVPREYILGIAQ